MFDRRYFTAGIFGLLLLTLGCGPVSCKCSCKSCEDGCSCSPDKKCDDKNCHCDR